MREVGFDHQRQNRVVPRSLLLLLFFCFSFPPKVLPWSGVSPEGHPWGKGPLGPACPFWDKHMPCGEADASRKHEGQMFLALSKARL